MSEVLYLSFFSGNESDKMKEIAKADIISMIEFEMNLNPTQQGGFANVK